METAIQNRNEAFIKEKPKFPRKRKLILDVLNNFPNGATSQQIVQATQLPINQISGRLTELSNGFYISAVGSSRNRHTGKNQTIWKVNHKDYRIMKQNEAFVKLRDKRDSLIRDRHRGVSTLGMEILQKEIDKINNIISHLG